MKRLQRGSFGELTLRVLERGGKVRMVKWVRQGEVNRG